MLGKNLDDDSRGIFQEIISELPWKNWEKPHEWTVGQDCRWSDRGSSHVPPEYNSKAL